MTTPVPEGLPDAAKEVLDEVVAELWRSTEQQAGDPTAADLYADVSRRTSTLAGSPPEPVTFTPYPSEAELAEAIEQAKDEILRDMCEVANSNGVVMPLSISSFSELHDYVDANEYGGLTDVRSHWLNNEDPIAHINALQDAVHTWLAEGHARVEKIAMWLYEVFTGNRVAEWDDLDDDGKDRWRPLARSFVRDLLPEQDPG